VASRRASEDLIRAGRVAVNGQVVREMGSKVDPLHDTVTADGATVRSRRKLYIALNKPSGYVSSRVDPRKSTVGKTCEGMGQSLTTWAHRLPEGSLIFLTTTATSRFASPSSIRHSQEYTRSVEGKEGRRTFFVWGGGGVSHDRQRSCFTRGKDQSVERPGLGGNDPIAWLRWNTVKARIARSAAVRSQGITVTNCNAARSANQTGELRVGKWRTLTPRRLNLYWAPRVSRERHSRR